VALNRLVLVDGEPIAGDVASMTSLKPDDFEVVRSDAGCFEKAVDVTTFGVPKGTERLRRSLRSSQRGCGRWAAIIRLPAADRRP
jgi:hypothetical protein